MWSTSVERQFSNSFSLVYKSKWEVLRSPQLSSWMFQHPEIIPQKFFFYMAGTKIEDFWNTCDWALQVITVSQTFSCLRPLTNITVLQKFFSLLLHIGWCWRHRLFQSCLSCFHVLPTVTQECPIRRNRNQVWISWHRQIVINLFPCLNLFLL